MDKNIKPKTEPAMGKGLTPYQGARRSFGMHRCSCGHKWGSTHSWANKGQICFKCQSMVYPHKQWRLISNKKRAEKDAAKAHKMELCEKCHDVGGYCAANAHFRQVKQAKTQTK